MGKFSLSQRLALLFTGALAICAVVACVVQLYSANQYGNAMVQRLSADLASQIVSSEKLLDEQDHVNKPALTTLFDRLMTLNPSVELYLISPQGDLLADAAPQGHIKQQKVAIGPIQDYLSGSAWPVYGSDPRSLDEKKVFSAAPIRQDGKLRGYLYIVLQGENLNALAHAAWQKALWNAVLWSLLLVAFLGVVMGGLVYYWVTRPVRLLTRQVGGLDKDSISTIKHLAALAPHSGPHDEVVRLHNAFIELARQISRQWDALSDSDRQRREFVANISHDLRTPLTSLLGYLETLSVKADTLSPEDTRRYFAIALRQGNKVRHLSQELFELARLEHGGIKPQLERFSAADLVQDVLQKFDLALSTRKLQLKVDVPSGLPLVNADLSMIERVLTNLVDNAIRHTPEGGMISVRLWLEGDKVKVDVSDNGPGIPEALRDNLFQRPSILDNHTASPNRGGLGLMIVRRMLQLHGCDIHLLDQGPGAHFRFSIPHSPLKHQQ